MTTQAQNIPNPLEKEIANSMIDTALHAHFTANIGSLFGITNLEEGFNYGWTTALVCAAAEPLFEKIA